MADVFPVDYTSPVGRVRKYIPDVLPLPNPKDPLEPDSFMWTDEALQSFIDDEVSVPGADPTRADLWRAAAAVLVATANNENLILKKLVTDDLQTDGPAVAKAMLQAANSLIARANKDDRELTEEETFTIVPYRMTPVWGL